MPVWLGGLLAGRPLVSAFASSLRVRNHKAKEILGWRPRHPSFRAQAVDLVAEYRRLCAASGLVR